MHSFEDQERFAERETMSDDVDELRRTVQGLRDEIRELMTENIALRESANDQSDIKRVSEGPPNALVSDAENNTKA